MIIKGLLPTAFALYELMTKDQDLLFCVKKRKDMQIRGNRNAVAIGTVT